MTKCKCCVYSNCPEAEERAKREAVEKALQEEAMEPREGQKVPETTESASKGPEDGEAPEAVEELVGGEDQEAGDRPQPGCSSDTRQTLQNGTSCYLVTDTE